MAIKGESKDGLGGRNLPGGVKAPPPTAAARAEREEKHLEKEMAGGAIRVRAITNGFFVGRRFPGDEFLFPKSRLGKDGKLPSWVERIDEEKK